MGGGGDGGGGGIVVVVVHGGGRRECIPRLYCSLYRHKIYTTGSTAHTASLDLGVKRKGEGLGAHP